MKPKLATKVFFVSVILALLFSAVNPAPTQAAGTYTHSWFVERAIQRLGTYGGYSELVGILNQYPGIVNYGAIFPDITYGGVDQSWADTLHDPDNYSKYLQYLNNKGYSKTNIDLQTGYYKAFLEDSNYTAVIPPFRAALLGQLLERFKHSPRSPEDQKMIAFVFGVIAHQEADVPFHWTDPNWRGLESEATNRGYDGDCNFVASLITAEANKSELCFDLVLRNSELFNLNPITTDYLDTARPFVFAASDSAGIPRPACEGGTAVCNSPSSDPLVDGQLNIKRLWDYLSISWSPSNAQELKGFVQNYVPGGIEYGSTLIAGAWMQAWDRLASNSADIHYYVKTAASGIANCSSWANACTLQSALSQAINGEVWVAAGTYKPTTIAGSTPTDAERKVSFQIWPGVAVYGGFTGIETARDQRDYYHNVTILSGDIDGNDSQQPLTTNISTVTGNTTNSYHVVKGANGSTLDGFVVTGGYAGLASGYFDYGGGMLNNAASQTVKNVTFIGNWAINGGGMSNIFSAAAKISNATFVSNKASTSGGALLNYASSPTLTNVTISGNTAVTGSGSTATGNGGGIYNASGSNPIIYNTILWGNAAPIGAQTLNNSSTPGMYDSVIQGGYPSSGGARIYVGDPLLDLPDSYLVGDPMPVVGIIGGSSAINKGNLVCTSIGSDQRGIPYVGTCDIGAYEFEGEPDIYYAKPDGDAASYCHTKDTACPLWRALDRATASGAEIWVMEGVYYPVSNFPTTNPADREISFHLNTGVSIYGGFPATGEFNFEGRDPDLYPTILSGDIDNNDTNNDGNYIDETTADIKENNSYHVVTGVNGAVLDGFIITGGDANLSSNFFDYGGGMYNDANSPLVSNVTFSGNYAKVSGGAAANRSSSSIFANVTFTGNKTDSYGGAVQNYIGSPTFTNVTFGGSLPEQGNTAGINGGAVENYDSDGTFANVFFGYNQAVSYGGAMNISLSSPTITDSSFYNNSASNGAGVNNTGSSGTYNNVTFYKNNAGWEGGGMRNTGSTPLLTNATFYQNTAVIGGGAIANITDGAPTLRNVTIYDNTVTQTGQRDGGGIYNFDTHNNAVSLWNVILWDNKVGVNVSNISHAGTNTNVHVDNTVLQGALPAGTWSANLIYAEPKLGTFGKLVNESTETIPILAGSSAINKGAPGICAYNTLGTDQRGVSYVGTCDIGAYEYNYTGTYYVNDAKIAPADDTHNCQSWQDACGLQTALNSVSSGDEIWVKHGVYYPTGDPYNRAATFWLVSGVGVYGGFDGTETERELRSPAANPTILSGDIDQNDTQTPVITDITAVNLKNTANSYHVVTGATGAILDGFTVTAGYASGSSPNDIGGGIYNNATSPEVSNVTFSGNYAKTKGGAVANETSNASFVNATFTSNKTDNWGGAVEIANGTPTFFGVTFSNNRAGIDGGAVQNVSSSGTFTNVIFDGNQAGSQVANYGGAINNTVNSSPTITNAIFRNNSAGRGGAMSNYSGSASVLSNVTFMNNSATDHGGGIMNYASSPTITNATFFGNTAIWGGAISNLAASSPVIKHATVGNNHAATDGGGMDDTTDSHPQVRNSIFWGNTKGTATPPTLDQICTHLTNCGTVTVSDSVIQGGFTGINIFSNNPQLGTFGNYGGFSPTISLHLGSSAIDNASDTYCVDVETDQRGIPRPQGQGKCDIGAFEGTGYLVFLPAIKR